MSLSRVAAPESERLTALPTRQCMAHRVLPLRRTVVATEMMTSTVAQLRC